MNLPGDLEDPWRSDQSENYPPGHNEWASLDTEPLMSSNILQREPLISGMESVSLDTGGPSVKLDTSSLLLGKQESPVQNRWGDTLDDINNHVSDGLTSGNMVNNVTFANNDDSAASDASKEDYEAWASSVRSVYRPMSADIILVEELPEREGLLFKHTNYLVKHLVELPDTEPSSDRTVIRRYSDFVWLQEVLLKKYPFRMIPDLPPKKIGPHGTDQAFLLKRQNGLSRFINLVVKHPVLRKDDLLLTFLTVPTDLLGWRKNASYDTTDEFTDKKIGSSFIKMWQKEMAERWNEVDTSLEGTLDLWAKITILVERYEKRLKFIGQERALLASMLLEFTNSTSSIYASNASTTVEDINDHLGIVSKHLISCNKLISDENNEMNQDLSPRFKTFIDVLLALRGLFERYKMLAGNSVPQLQRRIEVNTERMEQMKDKPDLKGAEYDKVRHMIHKDRRSVAQQMNRSWLIRECILEEYNYFQETQFLITDTFQRWAKLNMDYTELNSNQWEKLLESIQSMPVSR
ncbi:LADA_0B09978g1_1 [Lachancea dasiensis]|uniref:Sorting nexin MVP1 n=1 Tax=Lachancea dasiensis TaxID=1072105 RepID=A0A1G4IV24_9SACH|nr:LADA_0B09978g1_1 [Lachancea dasiensis]